MQPLAALAARFIMTPAIVLLAGCAQLQLGQPVPSIDNIQKARASGIAPLSLGHFAIATGKDVSLDQKVSARSNTIYSPYASSFARYLKETLAVDLAAAGLLDPASAIVVEGWLTDSQLDVPTGQARGSVAARFTLTKAGARIYDKEHRASATWAASFVGVEAVPGAINEYGLLYRKLVAMLLDDPAFRAAAKP